MVHSVPLNFALRMSLKNVDDARDVSILVPFPRVRYNESQESRLSFSLLLQVARSKEQTARVRWSRKRVPLAEDSSTRHSFANVHGTPCEARVHELPRRIYVCVHACNYYASPRSRTPGLASLRRLPARHGAATLGFLSISKFHAWHALEFFTDSGASMRCSRERRPHPGSA